MNFERGKSVKESLNLGIRPKRVVRVLEWKKGPDGSIGFFILGMDRAQEVLEEVSAGRRKVTDYLIDLFGETIPGQKYSEVLLRNLRGYQLEYMGNLYYIPEK